MDHSAIRPSATGSCPLSVLPSRVLKRALEDLEHENDRLQGRFEQFREVFIADMTVITLYQSLFETFPGYGDDHAGAKLHVVEAVSSGLPAEFSMVRLLFEDGVDLAILAGPY